MMKNLEDILRDFAEQIRDLVRQEILATLGGVPRQAVVRRSSAPRAGLRTSRIVPPPKKGKKRDPRALETLTSQLGAAIATTPGQRIEQIAKSLGVSSKELALPAKKLLSSRKIKTTGTRRATKYFPLK